MKLQQTKLEAEYSEMFASMFEELAQQHPIKFLFVLGLTMDPMRKQPSLRLPRCEKIVTVPHHQVLFDDRFLLSEDSRYAGLIRSGFEMSVFVSQRLDCTYRWMV